MSDGLSPLVSADLSKLCGCSHELGSVYLINCIIDFLSPLKDNQTMRVLVIPLILLLAAGCRLDYESAMMAEEIAEDIPDTILLSFTHTVVKNGRPTFRVGADRGEFYEKKQQTLFYNVNFQEFSAEGEVITLGTCSNARIYTDSDNIELWGGMEFYSAKEEASLTGQNLFWNDAEGTLSGGQDDIVEIEKDSGARLRGRGFNAELPSRTVRYQNDVSGTWISEDEDE